MTDITRRQMIEEIVEYQVNHAAVHELLSYATVALFGMLDMADDDEIVEQYMMLVGGSDDVH